MTDQTSDLILPSRAWLVLRVAWLVYIVGAAAGCVAYLSMHAFLLEADAGEFSMADPIAYANRLDLVVSATSLLVLGAFIVSVVGYGFFYHRSMLTAKAFEPEHATVSATGMWWWHAVPIALLWKPLEGVMQVWRVVHRQADMPDSVPWVFSLWWGMWILGNTISHVIERFHPGAPFGSTASEAPYDLANYFFWSVPPLTMDIICCVALWWITDRIYRAQQNIVEMRASEEPQAEQAPPADTEAPAES